MHVGAVRDDADVLAAMRPYVQGDCLVGFDAPLVVTNPTGQRPAETALNRDFRKFEAGAHPATPGSPSSPTFPAGRGWPQALGLDMDPRSSAARRAIEVYPHAATVALFRLARTLKYKAKPGRDLDQLKSELLRLMDGIEGLAHAAVPLRVAGPDWVELRRQVVTAQRKSDLRRAEDPIDAVVCAYVALYAQRCPAAMTIYGDFATGYIVTPSLPADLARTPVSRRSDPHGSLVDRCEHLDEIDQRRQRRSARIPALDQGGDHRTIDRADQRAHQFDVHGATRSLDRVGHGLGALPQAATHGFAQRGQAGTGDMALISRYQLLGKSGTGDVPHQQVDQHLGGGLGPPAPPGQRGDPRPELRDLDHPEVFDRLGDQIVERREVVGG